MLCGCGNAQGTRGAGGDRMKIVVTIFPEYDWVMNVLGDKASDADVTLLLDTGTDLHSYQPSASDILEITTSDLFIYVGGESDGWVEDVLRQAKGDIAVIDMMEVLGDSVKEEELVEGMQEDEDHDDEDHDADHHDEDHDDDHHHHDEGPEYDEHVWLSLRNASVITEAISDALCDIDPSDADTYRSNAAAYREKLAALDEKYKSVISESSRDILLFGDRFPFRYMTDDYGLKYYAAFAGCSSESGATFETITFLAGKVDELGLDVVLTTERSSNGIAQTVIQNTASKDQKILALDSMQTISLNDTDGSVSYLQIMENNLEILKEALN